MADDIDLTPLEFLRRYPNQEAWRERLAPCTTTGTAKTPRTELTEAGEQYVIPGAEKDPERGPAQRELW